MEKKKNIINIFKRNWLISRHIENEINKASIYSNGGILLDIGCGDKPYKRFFEQTTKLHLGIDIPGSPLIDNSLDIYGNAISLPIRNGTIGTVLCSEALQYTDFPIDVFKEFNRVLKVNGTLILTSTQMWHITNKPIDKYRFTKYGLYFLAENSGFDVLYHNELGGFWSRIGLKLTYFIDRFSKFKIFKIPILLIFCLSNIFFSLMDKIFFNEIDCINHIIICKKS